MKGEIKDRYIGLVAELAREFNISRPTVYKYLNEYYDKDICRDVRTCAIKKIAQHNTSTTKRNTENQLDGHKLFANKQGLQSDVPVYYIRGSRMLGLYTGFFSPRIHEQWRKEGLPYCVDRAGNFLYRTDNIVKFIEAKYTPQTIGLN